MMFFAMQRVNLQTDQHVYINACGVVCGNPELFNTEQRAEYAAKMNIDILKERGVDVGVRYEYEILDYQCVRSRTINYPLI